MRQIIFLLILSLGFWGIANGSNHTNRCEEYEKETIKLYEGMNKGVVIDSVLRPFTERNWIWNMIVGYVYSYKDVKATKYDIGEFVYTKCMGGFANAHWL